MTLKTLLLASVLFTSPAFAQHEGHDMTAHDMATMGHHIATPFEIAANKQIDALLVQVKTRPPSPATAAIWGDIRDASKAKYAEDKVAFDKFVKAANAKLALPAPAALPLPPETVLFKAHGRYAELKRQAFIALEPRIFPGKTVRKYNETAATTAAIAVVVKISRGGSATPAQITQATAAFSKASATLEDLIKRPTL